GAK
ncbi:N-acylneuraminate cytidylyltransferase, partial [Haemophilus influenzae]